MKAKTCATCNAPCFSTKAVAECHACQTRRQAGDFYSPAILSRHLGEWVPNGRGVVVWKPFERPTLQREQGKPKRRQPVALCGTDSGYFRHLRRTKTPPCDACKAAHSEYEWARQQRKAVA
jgi:hypothetical protein